MRAMSFSMSTRWADAERMLRRGDGKQESSVSPERHLLHSNRPGKKRDAVVTSTALTLAGGRSVWGRILRRGIRCSVESSQQRCRPSGLRVLVCERIVDELFCGLELDLWVEDQAYAIRVWYVFIELPLMSSKRRKC